MRHLAPTVFVVGVNHDLVTDDKNLMPTVRQLMCLHQTRQAPRWRISAGVWALVSLACFSTLSEATAQQPRLHYRFDGSSSLGAIGSWRLQRGGPLAGYFQPVELRAPAGTKIAPAIEGTFAEPQLAPTSMGLLIAPVYRFRVTNIPFQLGREVFPTIELIDRTYPPPHLAWKFPIPIELTLEDLRIALSGKLVTRVIYVEDPRSALPVQSQHDEQSWFDVGPGDNPLLVADTLGRPVAILRIGGRQPIDPLTPENSFLNGSPPVLIAPRIIDTPIENHAPEEMNPSAPSPHDAEELGPPPPSDDGLNQAAAARDEVRR